MDRERAEWMRIEAILDEALDLPPAEREGLIARRCGDDDALRARVSRLLAACRESERHFETPPGVPPEVLSEISEQVRGLRSEFGDEVPSPGTGGRGGLSPGDRVGAYQVVELLGRGGMGAVYLARRADGAFDRTVALKVVKRGMDTDEILARFQQERSILARLQHPSIATLLGGGVTPEGLPYFAMELVRGEPIDVWCDQRRLDLRDRIRLFRQVCDAVAYAHRSLVVHRDLKPSNIFVLPDGQPKLLDFGIAKLLEDDASGDLTAVAGRRLTPAYAAPEQVLGEPTTTATDVYALGVILYELLTGSRPYRTEGSPAEVERLVTQGAVAPPSRAAADPLAGQLRGDLDAIVLKAMRTEPDRRYASVEALAQDLDRFLGGLPVEARPDSLRYRAGKFVRRNRLAVGLGTAATVALVAGTVSTSILAFVADRERDQRELEAQRALTARDFVVDLFAGLDPDRLEGQTTFTRDELIELGIRNLDGLQGQPTLRAGILNTLGQVAFNLGDRDRAETFFQGAYDLLEGEAETLELATSMMGLGQVFQARLDFEAAESWLARAAAVNERLLPEGDPRLAEARASLAFALFTQGPDRFDEAEVIYQQLLRSEPPPPLRVRARISEGFADLRLGQGRFDEAERLYRRAAEERVQVTGRRDSGVARILWGVGHSLLRRGEPAAAAETYGESLAILTRIYGPSHADVGLAHYHLGGALRAAGELGEAASAYARAATLMESENPPGYQYAAYAWQLLGETQERLGRHREAEASYRAALAVYQTASDQGRPPDPRRVASQHRAVARTLRARGLPGEALVELRSSLAYLAPEEDFPRAVAAVFEDMAQVLRETGQADSASAYERRVSKLRADGLSAGSAESPG